MFRRHPEIEVTYEITPAGSVKGNIEPGGYSFDASIFAKPSKFGIDEGRISKLRIKNAAGEDVVEYDRGFAFGEDGKKVKLTNEQIGLIRAVKEQFSTEKTWTAEEKAMFDQITERQEAANAERQANPQPAGDNLNPLGFFQKRPADQTQGQAEMFNKDHDQDDKDLSR